MPARQRTSAGAPKTPLLKAESKEKKTTQRGNREIRRERRKTKKSSKEATGQREALSPDNSGSRRIRIGGPM